jgi:hypothetical protein
MRAVIVALAIAAALTGCDQNKQQNMVVSQNGTTASVSGNGEHITVTDAKSKETVNYSSNGLNGANLPAFVPVYPGGKVTTSVVGSGSSNGGTIVIETSDSPDAVIAFYKQKSAASGFTQTANMNMNGMQMFTATSDAEKKSLQVMTSAQNGKTQAQIIWGQK